MSYASVGTAEGCGTQTLGNGCTPRMSIVGNQTHPAPAKVMGDRPRFYCGYGAGGYVTIGANAS